MSAGHITLHRYPISAHLSDLALAGFLLRVTGDGDLYISNGLCTSPLARGFARSRELGSGEMLECFRGPEMSRPVPRGTSQGCFRHFRKQRRSFIPQIDRCFEGITPGWCRRVLQSSPAASSRGLFPTKRQMHSWRRELRRCEHGTRSGPRAADENPLRLKVRKDEVFFA